MCRTPPHFPFRLTAARLRITKPVRTAQVDSNSTRTDSYVAIRPDLEAQMQVDADGVLLTDGWPGGAQEF